MHEFTNIGYMDLQKTGSTWVVSVLNGMLDEETVFRSTHAPVRADATRDKPYFISVREPVSLYVSLFTFGCQKKGSAYQRFRKKGFGDLYDPTPASFEKWLDFVLKPENAIHVNKIYHKYCSPELIGMATFRLMAIAIPRDSITNNQPMTDKAAIESFVRQEVFFQTYVRTENLAGDLNGVLGAYADRIKLKRPITTAADLQAQFRKRNVSRKIEGLNARTVSEELKQRVAERDWLFAKLFGYDVNPKGEPSALIAGR